MEKLDPARPTMGATILYVLREGRHAGETRAAVVTMAFGGDVVPGLCNGTVLIDMANDGGADPAELFFSSAHYDGTETPARGTWRWPPLEGVAVAELRETESVTLGIHLHGAREAAEEIEHLIGKLGELGRVSGAAAVSVDEVTACVLDAVAEVSDHHQAEQLRARAGLLRAAIPT